MRRVAQLLAALCLTVLVSCVEDDVHPPSSVPPSGPFGDVLAYAAAGADTVFAVTDVAGCATCASLWRWDTDAPRWQRVRDFGAARRPFTDETVEYPPLNPWGLAMAADGKHGYISWDAEGLQETSDGGLTWRPVEIPAARGEVGSGTPAVIGDDALLLVEEPCVTDACGPGNLWRSRLGSEAWERVDQPPGYYYELATSGQSVLVEAIVDQEERLYRTADAADTWDEVPTPRNTAPGSIGRCATFATGDSVAVAACLRSPDGLTVLRTSVDGGRTWQDLITPGTHQHSAEYADEVVVLGTDRILVSTPKRTLLLDRTGRSVPAQRLPRNASSGTCTDRRTCVVMAARGQLWRTTDAGSTWRVLAEEDDANR